MQRLGNVGLGICDRKHLWKFGALGEPECRMKILKKWKCWEAVVTSGGWGTFFFQGVGLAIPLSMLIK